MDLGQQILWERECAKRGSESYYANQDRLREQGAGDTTDAISYLIKERLQDASEYLRDLVYSNRGRAAKYNAVIKMTAGDEQDYMKIAYLGLKSVLKGIQIREKSTVLKVALDIASRVEVDLKCRMFEAAHPAYYDTVRKSFAEQNVTDYVHKHKVMMKKFSDFDIEWYDWSPSEKVQIGTRILRAILNTFGDVIFMYRHYDKGKTIYKLDTTVQFDEWAAEFEKERGLLNPTYLPLKVPARAWEGITDGGYHTPALKMKFVKTKGKDHNAFVEAHPPAAHMRAVNKLQRTAWQVNDEVLRVQEEIYRKGLSIGMPSSVRIVPPPFPDHLKDVEKENLTQPQKEEIRDWKILAKRCYGREQQRKGQVLAFMQGHKLAKELREWDKLYFVYTCDFRGRIYCATSGLSPQGADPTKGLLRFGQGVVLGKSGVKWLAIQGANTYGEDKLSYEDRVAWINSQKDNIKRVVEDPISNREFWGNADKPYQFLAFCFEWVRCDYGNDIHAESKLPVGLDGSCNGLQHFSAILRDEVGAAATNLSPCAKPEDIYQQVADVTIGKLKEMDNPMAKKWLKVGITRKCAKRPVMTLPYGATQQSARTYIMEYVMDNWAKFELDESLQWEYAKFLTPILWSSISDVVIAAREGMDWLQKNVGKDYAKWLTPIGFPVYQFYKTVPQTRVKTMLDGCIQLRLRDMDDTGEATATRQRNGIAPNFIHSVDSTHMVMTINGTDLGSYAMIHDDYGTHAGNTEKLFVAIRKAFLKLYRNHDLLEEWAEQMGIEAPIPNKGKYNITDILEADYFFG